MASNWAKDEIAALVFEGHVQGFNGKLRAKENITRAEFVQIMDSLLDRYITKAGSYSRDLDGNVMVNVGGVVLNGIVISGDLIIGDGVGDGQVRLVDTIVTGRLVLRGGGENSIKIMGNSDIKKIIIARLDGKLRIYSEEGIEIEEVLVDGNEDVILEGDYSLVKILAEDVTVFAMKANIKSPLVIGENSKFILAEESVSIIEETPAAAPTPTPTPIPDPDPIPDPVPDPEPEVDIVINIPAIQGVSMPMRGENPLGTIMETDQYTGSVTWTPADSVYGASTVYRARIDLTPKTGYTLIGVEEDFFTVEGAVASNGADSGEIDAIFPETDPDPIPEPEPEPEPEPDFSPYFNYNLNGEEIIITGLTSQGQDYFTGDLVIPSKIDGFRVTTIEEAAFYNKQLRSVIIGNSVTTIKESAFYGNQIGSLTIGSSVIYIGDYAFYGNQISTLEIPDSVTRIGMQAFNENQINSLSIPNTVTRIEEGAFAKNNLSSIEIPASITKIEASVFARNNLSSVIIPNTVTDIGNTAFYGNQLESVIIPDSVTTIGFNAFAVNKLKSVTIPNSVISIEDWAFSGNMLRSVTLGTSLKTIKQNSFSRNKIAELIIPDSVTFIGAQAFSENEIRTLIIGNSVETIEVYAFDQNQISSVAIPDSVTNIGANPFMRNPELVISVNSNNPNYMSYEEGLYRKDGKTIISGNSYAASHMNPGLEVIAHSAFAYLGLASIEIPASVIEIEFWAFNSNKLVSLEIPSLVTILGNGAFGRNGPNSNSFNMIISDSYPGLWNLDLNTLQWIKQP